MTQELSGYGPRRSRSDAWTFLRYDLPRVIQIRPDAGAAAAMRDSDEAQGRELMWLQARQT